MEFLGAYLSLANTKTAELTFADKFGAWFCWFFSFNVKI